MYAVVEPGVITCDLAAAVAARGLFYPPDPGSMSVSTMGGNIAEKMCIRDSAQPPPSLYKRNPTE